jgi:hypothetical protein
MKLYYDDALQAAYMAREFGVKYHDMRGTNVGDLPSWLTISRYVSVIYSDCYK